MKRSKENLLVLASALHGATQVFPRPDGSCPVTWAQLTDADKERSVRALEELLDSDPRTPEGYHQLWWDLKIEAGWSHGEIYCDKNLTHPCLVPFDQLTETEQIKDKIWGALVEIFKPYMEK